VIVTGLAVGRGGGRRLWLWLGVGAASLAIGLAWPLGLPVGLLVALDLVLLALVVVESLERRPAGPEAPADAGAATGVSLP
jgi:hypothetical protein